MSADVEPIGPPWRDGQHCRHCHPQCDGRYDPHDGGVYHEVGEAFTWHPEYGCPVCRIVALLRQMADEAEDGAARLISAAGTSVLYGDGMGATSDYLDSDLYRAQASALRAAADRIENGDHLR